MKLVLAFHGTRDPRGAAVCSEIAAAVQESVDLPVEVAYADVRQPDVRSVVDGPCVVVPVFLAAGYHVRVDIPEQIGPRADVVLTSPVGLDAVPAVRDRLREAGFRRGDAVVLAAAGSSDARALATVRQAAALLGAAAAPVRRVVGEAVGRLDVVLQAVDGALGEREHVAAAAPVERHDGPRVDRRAELLGPRDQALAPGVRPGAVGRHGDDGLHAGVVLLDDLQRAEHAVLRGVVLELGGLDVDVDRLERVGVDHLLVGAGERGR
ncbi:sirohydrochlorin chelatase [Lentzea flaviverrucosa]|uniref:sirohydrochlorin chelatase n=1 Tax=Lentzea flaviverrucosa TaxID=200379 RepID=UPI001FED1421|nr:CbiX/SirB N-terminal domain-containing protein [Lentzea flaviverrucosa]